MTTKRSGNVPFEFIHRKDLNFLPPQAESCEVNLHGGFATDPRAGFGHLYYGMPDCGIIRIDPDLQRQTLIRLPEKLKPMNFHSTVIGKVGEDWRLFLPANNDALVAVIDLDGNLDFTLSRPEFDQYRDKDLTFAPTAAALVDQTLFVADGYGANYISTADVTRRQWIGIFGGKTDDPTENGRFSTAHGITSHHTNHHHLVIADRPNSRLQVHTLEGDFVASHRLPPGSWPCGVDSIHWQGRWMSVIGSLVDPNPDRPAPIYIIDGDTSQVLSTIRPKEDLGLEAVQHLHNVVWHTHQDRLYLVCQSWNPGYFFVLEMA